MTTAQQSQFNLQEAENPLKPFSTPERHMELTDLQFIPFGTYREKRDWVSGIDNAMKEDGNGFDEAMGMVEDRIANFDDVLDSDLDPLEVISYTVDFFSPEQNQQRNRRTRRSRGSRNQ